MVGDARSGFYNRMVTGPPGFEPGSEAPEAPVISKLYYGPDPFAHGSENLAPVRRLGAFTSGSEQTGTGPL